MGDAKKDPGLLEKLKQKLDRMLGRKTSQPKSLDITYKSNSDGLSARKAFRIDVDNMHVICKPPKIKCRLSDISATGIGFRSSKDFPVGELVDAVIFWSGKPVVKNLKLKIVRQEGKTVGCEFQNLDRTLDKIIHKIVLAAQKRLIQKKQSGKKTDTTDKEIEKEIQCSAKRSPKKGPAKKIKL